MKLWWQSHTVSPGCGLSAPRFWPWSSWRLVQLCNSIAFHTGWMTGTGGLAGKHKNGTAAKIFQPYSKHKGERDSRRGYENFKVEAERKSDSFEVFMLYQMWEVHQVPFGQHTITTILTAHVSTYHLDLLSSTLETGHQCGEVNGSTSVYPLPEIRMVSHSCPLVSLSCLPHFLFFCPDQ